MGPTFHFQSRCDYLTIYNLLARMGPKQRIRWLQGCCVLASRGAHPVKVSVSKGELDEVWADFRSVAWQGELTDDKAGNLAARILRGG